MPRIVGRILRLVAIALALLDCGDTLWARDHLDGFDSGETSWQINCDKAVTKVLSQRRNRYLFYSGTASENIEIQSQAEVTGVQLELPLPAARLISELKLSLWYRSNRDGARIAVRVVFPQQAHPRTGEPLTVFLDGTSYTKPGVWQCLECHDLERLLRQKLPHLRKQLLGQEGGGRDLDVRGLYVDRVAIRIQTGQGPSEFFLDELQFGPVIAPSQNSVLQVGTLPASAVREMEFRLDRLTFQGRPFMPRLVPYHDENISELAKLKPNLVWVPDYRDQDLLAQLQQHDLRAVACPPRPTSPTGDFLKNSDAHLAPLGNETAAISCWMIGNRIPPSEKVALLAWTEQVRNADRQLQRPLIGDVTGLEMTYSRELPLFGMSRHILHSSFGLRQYRDWLIERRNLAQPGSFFWTWIQTEPTPSLAGQRRAGNPILVEPEQIRLQTYAALSAGCRGIGFWTHSSLEADLPGNLERKLQIAQLNMEMELIEPCIATGVVMSHVKFNAQLPRSRPITRRSIDFGTAGSYAEKRALYDERVDTERRKTETPQELEAAIIRTDFGHLLLPVWYNRDGECVPDQMAANEAQIVVPGADESVSAWEISTTRIKNLVRKRVTGGIQITLEKFDMTSAVILTSDKSFKDKLEQKMETLKEASAQVSYELAHTKLMRVLEVDRRLRELGVGQLDAANIMSRATAMLTTAAQARDRRDFHGCRMLSNDVMQLCRILQRAYWNEAVRKLSSPVASPYAACFQTLPEHWEMVSRFGGSRSPNTGNLLPAGNFEDFSTLIAEGWKHSQNAFEKVQATAELYPRPRPKAGNYCLRLVAVAETGADAPATIGEKTVAVTTPAVTVQAGQLVYIGGWVRNVKASSANLDGALFYDNLGGPHNALRWRNVTGWEHFELLREVERTGELTCTMALSGLGDILFDDLQIIPYEVNTAVASAPPAHTAIQAGWTKPLNLFRKLPGLGSKPSPSALGTTFIPDNHERTSAADSQPAKPPRSRR